MRRLFPETQSPVESGDSHRFTVLTVCTGNVHRSPFAAAVLGGLARRVDPAAPIDVGGAGLDAETGSPADRHLPLAGSIDLAWLPSGGRARPVTSRLVDGSDLVLTMTASQREELVRRHPRALLRTFTLVEYARLTDAFAMDSWARALYETEPLVVRTPHEPAHSVPMVASAAPAPPSTAERLRDGVRAAARRRAEVHATPRDDIPDPVGGDDALFASVAARILDACERIVGTHP